MAPLQTMRLAFIHCWRSEDFDNARSGRLVQGKLQVRLRSFSITPMNWTMSMRPRKA